MAPVCASKIGVLAEEILNEKLLWGSELSGSILYEGAQGMWTSYERRKNGRLLVLSKYMS